MVVISMMVTTMMCHLSITISWLNVPICLPMTIAVAVSYMPNVSLTKVSLACGSMAWIDLAMAKDATRSTDLWDLCSLDLVLVGRGTETTGTLALRAL